MSTSIRTRATIGVALLLVLVVVLLLMHPWRTTRQSAAEIRGEGSITQVLGEKASGGDSNSQGNGNSQGNTNAQGNSNGNNGNANGNTTALANGNNGNGNNENGNNGNGNNGNGNNGNGNGNTPTPTPQATPPSKVFTISGAVDGLLVPGVARGLKLTVTNDLNQDILVTALSVSPTGPMSGDCTTKHLKIDSWTGGQFLVKRNTSGAAPGSIPIQLTSDATDACQGVVFTLAYSGTAVQG